MHEASLASAVAKIRAGRAYRQWVLGVRCFAIGGVLVIPAAATSIVVRSRLLSLALLVPTFAMIWAGTFLALLGMVSLYRQGLMPRGGTNRHRALTKAFWRDVAAPVRRKR